MRKLLSILGLFLMVGAILGLLSLHALFSPSPFVIVPQAAAVALMIWARITFGRRSFHAAANPTSGGLVTTGPYGFIRHPIYTAICLFVWPAAIADGSPAALALAALETCGAIVRMLCEEALLVYMYPQYSEYAAATKRMIPYIF